VLLTVIWGGSYTMLKLGFRDLPVFGSLLLRVIVATAMLLGWSRILGLPLVQPARARRYLLAYAASFVWSMSLLYVGMTQTTAGRASVLFNTQPFFTLLLLPVFVPDERLTARRLAGTALAFAGVVLIFADRLHGASSLGGDALIVLAALGWSGGTILTKRMPARVHPVSVLLWSVAALIPVTAALTLTLERGAPWRLTPLALVSVVYLGALAAAFSFVVFFRLLRTYSATGINAFVFLSPVFGVLIAWLVLGETMTLQQAAGALGVAAGILVVNTGG
jgi:drug/metabolite transporter (DMT)-like permease